MKRIVFNIVLLASLSFTSCENEEPIPDPTKFYPGQTILSDYAIQSFDFDSKGTAWIGTFSNGLIKYSKTETKRFDSLNSLVPNHMIWDVAVDRNDNVWIGSEGLFMYDGYKFTRFTTENSSIPEDVVWAIAFDSNDNVWFSSSRHQRGGLVKFDGSTFEVFTPDNSPLPANSIHDVEIDEFDNIWLTSFASTTESYLVKIFFDDWEIRSGSDYGDPPFIFNRIAVDSESRVFAMNDFRYYSPTSFSGYQALVFGVDSVQMFSLDSTIIFKSAIADHNDDFWCTTRNGYAFFRF